MLSAHQLHHFVEHGYVPLRGAIPRPTALACRDLALRQLAVPDRPPWPDPVVRGVVGGAAVTAAATSPPLVDVVAQLLEGERWQRRADLGLFVVRTPSPSDPGDTGWHVDAGFPGPTTDDIFSWYVNRRSRGRGLLLLVLLSDVGTDDAPTRILEGSHRSMPALLAPFGDDGVPGLLAPLPPATGTVVHATGAAGDVFVCHPFLVHAASWPHRGAAPRVIAQPPISIEGDLRLDLPEHERSVVARAAAPGEGA